MWRCVKCGEELEDHFDACWNCGTSKDGDENSQFHPEIDVAVADNAGRTGRRWNGFLAGAIAGAVAWYVDQILPIVIALPSTPGLRARIGEILLAGAILSLVVGVFGGLAGWAGSKTDRMAHAAWKGALILVPLQTLLVVFTGGLWPVLAMPHYKIAAMVVNMFVLGAIAGTVAHVFGKTHQDVEVTQRPLQHSLGNVLFILTLFGFLFASRAVLMR